MERSDWYLFILVFITGMFIGMFIYLTSFVPTYLSNGFSNDEEVASEFSVIGRSYGGFTTPDYIQPSFRLLGNGEYSYIPGGTDEDALEPVEGKLPTVLVSNIKAAATELKLNSYREPVTDANCRYFADGTDYEYRVILEGESYTLDTCETALGYNSDLALALDDVWHYLEDPSGGFEVFGGEGDFSDRASEWLRSQLDPYYEEPGTSGPSPSPSPRPRDDGNYTACTMEAKICPDGSAVGRTGPNCEFAPCPGE